MTSRIHLSQSNLHIYLRYFMSPLKIYSSSPSNCTNVPKMYKSRINLVPKSGHDLKNTCRSVKFADLPQVFHTTFENLQFITFKMDESAKMISNTNKFGPNCRSRPQEYIYVSKIWKYISGISCHLWKFTVHHHQTIQMRQKCIN